MPRQRRLPESAQAKAMSLMKLGANKKLVQQKLIEETGNVIILKDLSNIRCNALKGNSRNDLDSTVKLLMDKYGMIKNSTCCYCYL